MEPRVTRRERKLQLTYDLPHRIRCAQIFPSTAPNGSNLVMYGHDRGIKVLWRGGRRIKQTSTPQPAPGKQQDVIMLDESDDEPPPRAATSQPVEYEDEEDEQDPDAPYPSIIQELDIHLESPVLQLTLSSISSQPGRQPTFARNTALVVALTANGKINILRVPLAPPRPGLDRDASREILNNKIELPCGKATVRSISAKMLTQYGDNDPIASQSNEPSYTLLVAAASNVLRLWSIPISSRNPKAGALSPYKITIPSQATKISFSTLASSTRILIVDIGGAVRIYDPLPSQDQFTRPSSGNSAAVQSLDAGQWVMTYQAPFKTQPQDAPTLPTRKKILDAKWVLCGRAILVLLDDGEWGFWDLQPAGQSNKSIESFIVNGYVASATAIESESEKPKKGGAKLAPMTPNTRKAKADHLFTGPPKAPGAVARGGISVSASDSMKAQGEESVMLWYNNDIYSIANLGQYWHRNVSNAGSNAMGSLYSPGFARVGDADLMNENITSIAQFNARANNFGQMNTTRDFLVSAEHRYIISQSTRSPAAPKGLFQQALAATTAPTDRDQRMLDAGELDIGGMDRMLDSMANGGGRPRRVGFAH